MDELLLKERMRDAAVAAERAATPAGAGLARRRGGRKRAGRLAGQVAAAGLALGLAAGGLAVPSRQVTAVAAAAAGPGTEVQVDPPGVWDEFRYLWSYRNLDRKGSLLAVRGARDGRKWTLITFATRDGGFCMGLHGDGANMSCGRWNPATGPSTTFIGMTETWGLLIVPVGKAVERARVELRGGAPPVEATVVKLPGLPYNVVMTTVPRPRGGGADPVRHLTMLDARGVTVCEAPYPAMPAAANCP